MADKLFKDYFEERQEDNSIVGNTKILIKRGNNVRKIDVDQFATAAQGDLADNSVQLTGNQNISGVKTFSDNVGIGTTNPSAKLDVQGNTKITGTLDLNDGSNRTIVGTDAGGTGTNQSAFGYLAGESNTGTNQSAFGYFAGRQNTGGNQSAFGYLAGYLNIGGNQSVFGRTAGFQNSGASQSAFGYFAGRENAGGSQSAFGYEAGYLNTGDNQTAVGYFAGRDNIGNNNIAIGFESSYGNEGDNVLSIGYQAGKGNTQSKRTIIDNALLPEFASFTAAESAFGTGQPGMTYLFFNTTTNAIEGVRF
jgi:hypothetical protein